MNFFTKNAPWLIALAALLWAVDAPFRKYLTEELPSSLIVLSEHIFIVFFVLPIFIKRFQELKKLKMREWGAVIFIAAGGSALATVFFTQAFHHINPSVAILLQKVQPFIAILLAVWILREILPKRFYLWAGVGICGAYLVSFPEIVPKDVSVQNGTMGVLYALLAAFFWGGSTVMGRLVLAKITWPMMTAVRFVFALIFLFLLNLWNGNISYYSQFTVKDGIYAAIIALLAGLVALFIYYRGLKDTKASAATIAELAFPFSAVVVNWIFLDAALQPVQIIGGLILLLSITQVTSTNYELLKKEITISRPEPKQI